MPFLLRRVSEKLKANWQAPKHSSYLWQTEQTRKLDTVFRLNSSMVRKFGHGPRPLSPSIFAAPSMTENVYKAVSDLKSIPHDNRQRATLIEWR